MLKYVVTAAIAAALFAAVPLQSSFAQTARPAATPATPAKPPAAASERKLSPQQAKMKECGAKWQAHKKEAKVSGRAEHRKFMSTCLKA